ncbi:MAG: hypothetical protein ACJ8AW_20570 [Rhodopila sp.]
MTPKSFSHLPHLVLSPLHHLNLLEAVGNEDCDLQSVESLFTKALSPYDWRAVRNDDFRSGISTPPAHIALFRKPSVYCAGCVAASRLRCRAPSTKRGLSIKLAAKVDKADQDYFDGVIRPLLNEPGVDFAVEIREHEKANFWAMQLP